MKTENGKPEWFLLTGDAAEVLQTLGPVDLTVTSPPYDGLRVYNGYQLEIKAIIRGLYKITAWGGVVVWIINDQTIGGNETGTSFRHALMFQEAGFNLWDTMIWKKTNPSPTDGRIRRYQQSFEYMFVFTKGTPKTFNPRRVPTKNAGKGIERHNNYPARRENGHKSSDRVATKSPIIRDTRVAHNVLELAVHGATDAFAKTHPATFPEKLAEFHVLSWSNPGDVILDPFSGAGTTGKMAVKHGRNYIGIDVSREYNDLAERRIEGVLSPSGGRLHLQYDK